MYKEFTGVNHCFVLQKLLAEKEVTTGNFLNFFFFGVGSGEEKHFSSNMEFIIREINLAVRILLWALTLDYLQKCSRRRDKECINIHEGLMPFCARSLVTGLYLFA